ncbi:MAG: hypothetical protein PVJ28_12485 [Acidimicrobiia bacterium]|jgi:hypothetical protein
MTEYDARLQIEGDGSSPLPVTVDLTGDHLRMRIGDEEVADWARDQMRIQALPDGFHIRAEGEAVILDVSDDARFAVELGLRNAHPALRQKMAALLRSEDD